MWKGYHHPSVIGDPSNRTNLFNLGRGHHGLVGKANSTYAGGQGSIPGDGKEQM